jgi:hypothetical protein
VTTESEQPPLFKRCPDCTVEKSVIEFSRNAARPDGLQFYCKSCYSSRSARNYRDRRLRRGLRVRDKVDAPRGHKYCPSCKQVRPHSEWHRARSNRDGLATSCKDCRSVRGRRDHLKRAFGITQEDLDALLASQGGTCAICRESKPEHIDHDHKTGRVRGVLCGPCNMGLGLFKDDQSRLKAAIDYLRRDRVAALGLTVTEVEHTCCVIEVDFRRLHAA